MSNTLNHLAIIMDGNGRWAKQKGFVRVKGHELGAQKIEEIVKCCIDEKIKILTLYTFSTENWKRPKVEVDFLMKLLKNFLISKRDIFIKNEIKFSTIGDLTAFNDEIRKKISELKEATKDFTKLEVVIALNYGSKDEIVRACNRILAQNGEINEKSIAYNLDISQNIDLLIRTGKEKRLSNFMLWQASYAELYFSDTLWPDFSADELKQIIDNYKFIDRRFGGL